MRASPLEVSRFWAVLSVMRLGWEFHCDANFTDTPTWLLTQGCHVTSMKLPITPYVWLTLENGGGFALDGHLIELHCSDAFLSCSWGCAKMKNRCMRKITDVWKIGVPGKKKFIFLGKKGTKNAGQGSAQTKLFSISFCNANLIHFHCGSLK